MPELLEPKPDLDQSEIDAQNNERMQHLQSILSNIPAEWISMYQLGIKSLDLMATAVENNINSFRKPGLIRAQVLNAWEAIEIAQSKFQRGKMSHGSRSLTILSVLPQSERVGKELSENRDLLKAVELLLVDLKRIQRAIAKKQGIYMENDMLKREHQFYLDHVIKALEELLVKSVAVESEREKVHEEVLKLQ